MSVTIGRENKITGEYAELCVAFQSVFNNVWEKAIQDRNLHLIGCCKILHKKDLPEILWEFAQVKDYVLTHDFSENDKIYVSQRVDEILENLESFWNEIPDTDQLDMG
ncbi:MAG: hypothetical protein IJ642_00970 [Oscillospiraceae bacterium]|nr:hypothetical protein [Oscillospiraceae bacterium]